MEEDTQKFGSWRMRRRVMTLALLFCAGVISYSLFMGLDTALANSAVNASFLMSGSIILGYLGFATQDDRNIRKIGAHPRAR